MTVTKLAAAVLFAASTFGAVAIAQAQTTPNDTSAQAKPSEKPAMPGQPMTQPTTVSKPGTAMPATPSNDTSAQAHPGDKPAADQPPMKKKHMAHKKPMPAPANGQPMGSPDSGTAYSPATATDNTTVPAPKK